MHIIHRTTFNPSQDAALTIPRNNKVGRKPSWLAANLVCSTAMVCQAAIDVRQCVTLPIRHTSAIILPTCTTGAPTPCRFLYNARCWPWLPLLCSPPPWRSRGRLALACLFTTPACTRCPMAARSPDKAQPHPGLPASTRANRPCFPPSPDAPLAYPGYELARTGRHTLFQRLARMQAGESFAEISAP